MFLSDFEGPVNPPKASFKSPPLLGLTVKNHSYFSKLSTIAYERTLCVSPDWFKIKTQWYPLQIVTLLPSHHLILQNGFHILSNVKHATQIPTQQWTNSSSHFDYEGRRKDDISRPKKNISRPSTQSYTFGLCSLDWFWTSTSSRSVQFHIRLTLLL